ISYLEALEPDEIDECDKVELAGLLAFKTDVDSTEADKGYAKFPLGRVYIRWEAAANEWPMLTIPVKYRVILWGGHVLLMTS
ncbi:hypothetical protein LCGC14_3074080, partial [marine sediment metagenome]